MEEADGSSVRVWRPHRGDGGPRHDVAPGTAVRIGREGDLLLGSGDRGVSRLAATVAATADGWRIEITNANGGAVHPWGQPVSVSRLTTLAWPRIAVRIEGQGESHWVLLESTRYSFPDPSRAPTTGGATEHVQLPRSLSPAEEATLRAVFRPQLAWPPPMPGPPRLLKNVAREFGVTIPAVRNNLQRAREKAVRLGLRGAAGLTHVDYVFVLVQAGYLWPEDADADDADSPAR